MADGFVCGPRARRRLSGLFGHTVDGALAKDLGVDYTEHENTIDGQFCDDENE